MASGALKGALIGAATGAVGGGMKSTLDYYEEHGTIDGSGSQILSGSAQGFAAGAVTGAASGAMAGVVKYHKNPKGYCFVAGTLVLTTVGLVSIEDIQAGDMVYAKEAVGEERTVDLEQETDIKPVLNTFVHEVDETYIVTINDESIETTGDHPFYDENGEVVEAKDLQEGDKLPTYDGSEATVTSVECIHHDEPVKVYNFCVMEDHTYFIGENGVLVHNSECQNDLAKKINNAKEEVKNKTSRGQAFRQAKEASGIPKSAQYKTHKFVYDGSTENRVVFEFEVDGKKKYIIQHPNDKFGRGNHFHGADDLKGNPFNKGVYNQYDGHFPEDFDGFF